MIIKELEKGGVVIEFDDSFKLRYESLEWSYIQEFVDLKIDQYLREHSLSPDESEYIDLKSKNDTLDEKIRAIVLQQKWEKLTKV